MGSIATCFDYAQSMHVCIFDHKWVNCNNTLATHIDDTQSMHYALSLEYHKIILIATHIDDAQVHALMHPPLNIIVNGWILDLGREGKQAEPVAVLAFVLWIAKQALMLKVCMHLPFEHQNLLPIVTTLWWCSRVYAPSFFLQQHFVSQQSQLLLPSAAALQFDFLSDLHLEKFNSLLMHLNKQIVRNCQPNQIRPQIKLQCRRTAVSSTSNRLSSRRIVSRSSRLQKLVDGRRLGTCCSRNPQKRSRKKSFGKKIFEKQKASVISTFSKNHKDEKNIRHSVRIMSALSPTMQNFVVNSPAPKLSAASDTSKTPAKTGSSGSQRERERERERERASAAVIATLQSRIRKVGLSWRSENMGVGSSARGVEGSGIDPRPVWRQER